MNTSLVLSSNSVFNFNAEHNGIECIESTKPEDRGSENQFWFTAKMLSENFQCKVDTVKARVESLIATGDLDDTRNVVSSKMPYSNGSLHDVTLYNLTVFNKIAMTFIDNPKAVEIRSKFNDVLVKEETKKNTVPALSEEDHFFLNILHAKGMEEIAVALKDYKSYRDEKEQKLEQEKDDAVRKRHAINDKRTATLMVKSREDNKKINQLTCENNELREQNEILKVSIGESNQWMSSAQLIQNFDLQRINGKPVKTKSLTMMLKKCGCKNKMSEFPDNSGFRYTIFFVEDVKKALNIF